MHVYCLFRAYNYLEKGGGRLSSPHPLGNCKTNLNLYRTKTEKNGKQQDLL